MILFRIDIALRNYRLKYIVNDHVKEIFSLNILYFLYFFLNIPIQLTWLRDGGGQCWLVLGLLFRILAELKSNGHNNTRIGLYDL